MTDGGSDVCSDGTNRSKKPTAAFLQGTGIGLSMGWFYTIQFTGRFITAFLLSTALGLITLGYWFDKRAVQAGTDRSGGADDAEM